MKLTGKIIRIESSSRFVDKRQRIIVKVNEASGPFGSELELINEDEWSLDDEIEIFVFKKATEVELAEKLMRSEIASTEVS